VGSKEVLPKAHPNDGRFDLLVVEKEMKLSQRLQAWRRITTTSHIPHPLISTQQLPSYEWALGGKNARSRRIRMAVDGEDVGPVTGARFEIIPDALTVYL
jgi:diacylglycerol kinase family enzyme